MGISKELTGSPWHIEKMHRSEGDNRRHRHNCVYFDKKTQRCKALSIKCFGSAHCTKYSEKAQDSETPEISSSAENKPKRGVKRIKVNSREKFYGHTKCQFDIGDRVKHKRYGEGTVIKISDNSVTVQFRHNIGIKQITLGCINDTSSYHGRDDDLWLISKKKSKR